MITVYLYEFFFGFLSSLSSPLQVHKILTKKEKSILYLKIIIYNFCLLVLPNLIYDSYYDSIYTINPILSHISFFFIKFVWNVPIYACSYIISMEKLGNVLNYLDSNQFTSETFEKSLYFLLLSTIFYIFINIFSYIPIVGNLLSLVFISHSYGFFCLEYTCSYKKIENIEKITLIEKKPLLFIGYGLPFSIAYIYFTYIQFLFFFVIIFPLAINKLITMDIYNLDCKTKYGSKIFIFPIYILNTLLSILDSYIISNYNLKLSNDCD